jgi:hypothetical protein
MCIHIEEEKLTFADTVLLWGLPVVVRNLFEYDTTVCDALWTFSGACWQLCTYMH